MASELEEFREENFANSRWGSPLLEPDEEELTPAERQSIRARETALRLMEEGRFSTPEQRSAGGHAAAAAKRRRKQPLQDIMSEMSRDVAPELFNITMGIARSVNTSARDRIAAIQLLMNATDWSERIIREDEARFAKLKGEDLQKALAGAMAEYLGVDTSYMEKILGLEVQDADVVRELEPAIDSDADVIDE